MPLRKIASTALLMACFFGTGPSVQAASVDLTLDREWFTGTVKHVQMGGHVALAPGEQVVDVRLYYYPTAYYYAHNITAQVQGTYTASTKTWAVAVSDYQIYMYYSVVTVQSGGRKYTYASHLTAW